MDERKTAVLTRLNETRTQFMAALDELEAEAWETAVYTAEGNDDAHWTVSDIVRHLLNAEKGMTGLMMKIRETGEGVPEDFDRDWYNQRQVKKIKDKTPLEMMDMMRDNRQKLLAFIDTLELDEWEKSGRHASLQIMTIEEVCYTIANHEHDHFVEFQALL